MLCGYLSSKFTQIGNKKYLITMEDIVEKTNINYIGVLDYLRDNIEVPYSNPAAVGIDEAEKDRLLNVISQ